MDVRWIGFFAVLLGGIVTVDGHAEEAEPPRRKVTYELVPHVVLPESIRYYPQPSNTDDRLRRSNSSSLFSPYAATYTPYPSYTLDYPTPFVPHNDENYPLAISGKSKKAFASHETSVRPMSTHWEKQRGTHLSPSTRGSSHPRSMDELSTDARAPDPLPKQNGEASPSESPIDENGPKALRWRKRESMALGSEKEGSIRLVSHDGWEAVATTQGTASEPETAERDGTASDDRSPRNAGTRAMPRSGRTPVPPMPQGAYPYRYHAPRPQAPLAAYAPPTASPYPGAMSPSPAVHGSPYGQGYHASYPYAYPVPMPSAYPPYMYGYPYMSAAPAVNPYYAVGHPYTYPRQAVPRQGTRNMAYGGMGCGGMIPPAAYHGVYGGAPYRPMGPPVPCATPSAYGAMNYAMPPWQGTPAVVPRKPKKEKKTCEVGYWLLPPLIHKPLEKMREAWDDPYLPPDTGMRLPSKNAYPWGYFGAKVQPQSTCYSGYYGDYFSTRTYPGY